MIIGITSFYEDGTPSVQVWDTDSKCTLGEFVKGSSNAPQLNMLFNGQNHNDRIRFDNFMKLKIIVDGR